MCWTHRYPVPDVPRAQPNGPSCARVGSVEFLELSSDERTVLAAAGRSLRHDLERMMLRVHESSAEAAPGYLEVVEREEVESYESNLTAICSMLQHGAWKAATPPDALEAARLAARAGMSAVEMARIYHAGQDVLWLEFVAPAIASESRTDGLLARCLEVAYRMLSEYLGRVEKDVCEQLRQEQLRTGTPAQRIDAVRSVLAGYEPGEELLGHSLRGRQIAFICWTPLERATRPPVIIDVATLVAKHLPAGSRLLVQAAARTAFGWVNLRSADQHVDPASIEAALRRQGLAAHVALGSVASGVGGFRSSHEEAQRVMQYVIASNRVAPSATDYGQVAYIALLLADREQAESFARRQLGPLADDSPALAELRDTVRVYLESHRSQSRTAELLHVHRNTVGNRVQRAEELLGVALEDSRPELYAALAILKAVTPTR